jgi:hypothetical protein
MQVQLSLARLLWELLIGIIIDILFFCFACAILTDLSFTLQLISIVKITSFVPYLHDRVALSAYTVVELFLVLIRKVMMV